jgi:WD40 repeat protein
MSERELDVTGWNEAGRAHVQRKNAAIEAVYLEGVELPDLELEDGRSHETALAVMDLVVSMNRDGRAHELRSIVDPALDPFQPIIGDNARHHQNASGLDMPIACGDNIFVRERRSFDQSVTWKLSGTSAEIVPDITAMAISADRSVVATIESNRLTTRQGYGGQVIGAWELPSLDWLAPTGATTPHLNVLQLAVSNDGCRVAAACYDVGIVLASRRANDEPWRLIYPNRQAPFESTVKPLTDRFRSIADMLHCDVSPDGRFLAVGHQNSDHYVLDLDAPIDSWLHAHVGIQSEYPHHARFSSDGRYIAFNSCHFYGGATVTFEVSLGPGVSTESYIADPASPVIDEQLRVYSSTWLPPGTADESGVFCLHGVGVLKAITPTGRLCFVQELPASGGGMDFEPDSGRLLVCGHSGILHILDARTEAVELHGEQGWKPRPELARWMFWSLISEQPLYW